MGIRAGVPIILWPDPTSVYACVETTDGYAPGIAFCAEHAPKLGEVVLLGFGPVVRVDTAKHRYAAWYDDAHGMARRAWLRDTLLLEPAQIDALMAQWQADRE